MTLNDALQAPATFRGVPLREAAAWSWGEGNGALLPGVYAGVSDTAYHDFDRSGALSRSMLTELAKSPAHLRAKLTGAVEDTDTPALIAGRLSHGFLLEKKSIEEQGYVSRPAGMNFTTKEGKAWKESALLSGLQVLDAIAEKVVANLPAMRDAILANTRAAPMLTAPGRAELSIVAKAADCGFENCSGLTVRVRPDFLPEEHGTVFDLKTALDASPAAFLKSAFPNYHLQAALYLRALRAAGFDIRKMRFVAVEKIAPFCVEVFDFTWDSNEFQRASSELQRLLQLYAQCRETDIWHGYTPTGTVTPLIAPPWAAFAGEAADAARASIG
jgi:hypothetical protein